MRIEKIVFKNFRQIRNLELHLKKYDRDIHIYVAQNGTAKTNILNAINWCLYGDEPHLSSKSHNLPLLNLNVIEESNINSKPEVFVELHVRNTDETLYIFKRKKRFSINKTSDKATQVIELSGEFSLSISKVNQIPTILKDDDAAIEVERFIPISLRDFYFFDGERLDTYFKDITGGHVKEAINNISNIDTIRTMIKHLNIISSDLSRELSSDNPDAISTHEQIDNIKSRIEENERFKDKYLQDESDAKNRLAELKTLLGDIQDIAKMEEERSNIEKKNHKISLQIDGFQKEKGNIIYEVGKYLLLANQIDDVYNLILEKRKNNELPPLIDKTLLEESVKSDICKICSVDLPEPCREIMNKLLERFELSSKIAFDLTEMLPVIRSIKDKMQNFYSNISIVSNQINDLQEEYDINYKRQKAIDSFFESHQIETIKQWSKERTDLEEAINLNREKLGILKKSIEDDTNNKTILELKLSHELEKAKDKSNKQSMLKIVVATINLLNKLYENVNNRIRIEVEKHTNYYFKKLIWKKETYDKVIINKDFNVELYHHLGYSALGSTSAAERELLALSFTLALHKISGFEGPIFIDTPVARVAGPNRVNMGEVLLEISEFKQLALLFTPDEFSENIRQVLLPHTQDKNRISMMSNEREVKLEDF